MFQEQYCNLDLRLIIIDGAWKFILIFGYMWKKWITVLNLGLIDPYPTSHDRPIPIVTWKLDPYPYVTWKLESHVELFSKSKADLEEVLKWVFAAF